MKEVIEANAVDRLIDIPSYYLKASEYGNDTKLTVNGHFEIPSTQYHYHMETQQCLCVPNDGEIDIYSSSQWSDTLHVAVAEVLNVPVNSLNTYVKRVGGAFGGKISKHAHVSQSKLPLITHKLMQWNILDGLRCCSRLPLDQEARSLGDDDGRQHARCRQAIFIIFRLHR